MIPVVLTPVVESLSLFYISEILKENVPEKAAEVSQTLGLWSFLSTLFSVVLCAPFYVLALVLLYKLRRALIPKNNFFVPLFISYVIFSLLFSEIYKRGLSGLISHEVTEKEQFFLNIFNWVDLLVGFILGCALMVTLLGKRTVVSLLGIAGLIYVSRSLLSIGATGLIRNFTIDVFWVHPLGLYCYYFCIGYWIIVANRFLEKRRI